MKGVSGWPLHYIGFGFLVSQGNSGHLITKKKTKLKCREPQRQRQTGSKEEFSIPVDDHFGVIVNC